MNSRSLNPRLLNLYLTTREVAPKLDVLIFGLAIGLVDAILQKGLIKELGLDHKDQTSWLIRLLNVA